MRGCLLFVQSLSGYDIDDVVAQTRRGQAPVLPLLAGWSHVVLWVMVLFMVVWNVLSSLVKVV